jgi:hypothetical protein
LNGGLTMPHRIMNPSGIQSNVSLAPRGARTFAPLTLQLFNSLK